MACGYKVSLAGCARYHHHWMRWVKNRLGRSCVRPVGLAAPLPDDFCLNCRVSRAELLQEGSA